MGGRRGGGRPGGDQPGAADRPERTDRPTPPSSAETEALKTVLASEGASATDIKAKLEALRDTRKKAAAELDQAREELRKVLTLRQEATLVMVGVLE
jgi:Spy/CpxP family protein refolding chaperone